MFYSHYSIWFSIFTLILIYIVVRFFEYKIGLEVNYKNDGLLFYIAILLIISLIIRFLNSPNRIGGRGVWGHFKEYVETLFEEKNFIEIFDQHVCKHNKMDFSFEEKGVSINHKMTQLHQKIRGSELQSLLTSIKYIDKVVKLKLSKILSDDEYVENDRDHLRNTISALIEMLITLNQNRYRFRGALLIKNNEKYLTPLVTVPFSGQPFLSYRDEKYFCEKLSEESDAIAVQAWQKKSIVSASNGEIPIFHPEQAEYLRSIIVLPIIIDRDIQELFLKKEIQLEDVLGVVCIDCDNEIVFSKENQYLNDLIITPFVNRILFQMLFAVKVKNEDKSSE